MDNNSKSDISFLHHLLKIFEITFSSLSENESTDAKQKALSTLIDSEMKDIEIKKFLSIQNISDENFDFSKSIKEDLKYLLINFRSEFLFFEYKK